MHNLITNQEMLIDLLGRHYGQEFLYQVHKIVGSADFLGNPVGLFNNLSSAVYDIFYEPYQGFVVSDRPQDLGVGIAKVCPRAFCRFQRRRALMFYVHRERPVS